MDLRQDYDDDLLRQYDPFDTPLYYSTPAPKRTRSERFSLLVHVFTVLLGAVQVGLASWWAHWQGVLLGVVTLFVEFILIWPIWTKRSCLSRKIWVKWFARPTYAMCRLLWLGVLMFLCIIPMISPDPHWVTYPQSCLNGGVANCCRIGVNPQCYEDIEYPQNYTTTMEAVTTVIDEYVSTLDDTDVLYHQQSDELLFTHLRVMSGFWGFADDFAVQAKCVEHKVQISVMSESRLGSKDFGVNAELIRHFLSKLPKFPRGGC